MDNRDKQECEIDDCVATKWPRIDVAVLSRFELVAVRSFQHIQDGNRFLFSRDCLEVDVNVNGKILTLFVNHLKSMLDEKHPAQGRKNTRAKRVKQAAEVKKIVQARFGADPGAAGPWAVLGDLNDFLAPSQGTTSGISSLVTWPEVENVVGRLPAAEQWIHFFERAPAGGPRFRQLDYTLLSSSLAAASAGAPVIVRKGLSTKATARAKRFKAQPEATPTTVEVGRTMTDESEQGVCPPIIEGKTP